MDDYLNLLQEARSHLKRIQWLRSGMTRRLNALSSNTHRINGGIHAKGSYSNPTMKKALANVDDEIAIKREEEDLEACKARILKQVERADNPLMLQSLYWRIVCDYEWDEVIEEIGGQYTVRGLRRSVRKLAHYCTDAYYRELLEEIA